MDGQNRSIEKFCKRIKALRIPQGTAQYLSGKKDVEGVEKRSCPSGARQILMNKRYSVQRKLFRHGAMS
jgi:hypothetical protein